MAARDRRTLATASLLFLLTAASLAADSHGYRFTTFEGEVRAVGEFQGEDELKLLSVDLLPRGRADEEVTILLGPVETCREIGLVVEEGDRLRAKVFVGKEGEPVKAQKVLNLSRSVMIRLRTMRDVPLWNAAGSWQGAPGRQYHGGHHGARQGPGGPGRRPGGR